MTKANQRFIRLRTTFPVPKAQALLKRKEENVPPGPFNTVPSCRQGRRDRDTATPAMSDDGVPEGRIKR